MKITNLKKDALLAPRLKDVLELIYAKRPLLEYEVSEYSDNSYAQTVIVWQDGQKIGEIHARYQRYSPAKGCHETWYGIESHNIQKQRGYNKSMKFCKDVKVAARTAIEMFTKRTLAELGKNLIVSVKSAVNSLYDRVEYDYKHAMSWPSLTLTNYFIDLQTGKNPPIPTSIAIDIVKKDMVRKHENYEIAKNVASHCKLNNGYALKVMKDETILFTRMGDPNTTSKLQSTYDLDQYTQEKYTMLKLLDESQFAADIGVKYEYDSTSEGKTTVYFIVGGETKVM